MMHSNKQMYTKAEKESVSESCSQGQEGAMKKFKGRNNEGKVDC